MSMLNDEVKNKFFSNRKEVERSFKSAVSQVGVSTRKISHMALYLATKAAAGNAMGEAEYMASVKPELDAQRELLRGYLVELDALAGLSDADPTVVSNTLSTQTTATGFDMNTYLSNL